MSNVTRREFIAWSAVAAGMLTFEATFGLAETKGGIPYRPLGRTGEKVSAIGVGGFHIGKQDISDELATRIIRTALDNGINFMDNCWDYNNGRSEERMGVALQNGYRQKAFLMTKIDARDQKTATTQINDSLKRLKTDHIDLLQIHENIRMNDADRVFANDGAIHAILDAKKAGKIRFIGFTGHKDPKIHLHMLDVARQNKFHFDTVQMPLNIFDAHFNSFQKQVVPVAVEEGVGILGMKPMGDAFLLDTKTVTPVECLHWELNLPTSVVITGIDSMVILNQDLKALKDFKPLTREQMTALLQKTSQVASKGEFEKYKTSHRFDGTHNNPHWLGPQGEAGQPAPA